jgi:hypothetical protein
METSGEQSILSNEDHKMEDVKHDGPIMVQSHDDGLIENRSEL